MGDFLGSGFSSNNDIALPGSYMIINTMKYIKIFSLTFLILIISIIISWIIFNKYYLNDVVRTGIEQHIDDLIENDFEFELEDAKVNWTTRDIRLTGFNLSLFNQADTIGFLKGDMEAHVKSWIHLLFNKRKIIESIVLKDAEIYYAYDHPLMLKKKTEKDAHAIEIKSVSCMGQLLFATKHKQKRGQLVTKFEVTSNLNLNTTDTFDTALFINQLTNLQLSELHYYFNDGFYKLSIADIAFSNLDSIMIRQITVNPIHSRKSFAQKKKVATDYISAVIDSIQLTNLDGSINERIYIEHIKVHQPNIDLFRDKNYPDNQKYKPILVDLLREHKTPIHIKSMDVEKMFLKYTELAKDANEPGELYFSEANATITNISNVQDSIKMSTKMQIEATAKLYGAAKLHTAISYDLIPGPGKFSVNGSLSPMDISRSNAIVSKLLPVRIKSGRLHKLHFNFSGTRMQSDGVMWFEYTDLKMEFLKANRLDNKFTRKMMNFAGHRMIRNSNPARNGTFRVGAIKQNRDTTKSMFNFWWISLRSGFLSSLGATEEKKIINYKRGEDATIIDKMGLGKK